MLPVASANAGANAPEASFSISSMISLVIAGLTQLNRKRWKDMPPPAGVTAEQWQGFLDHRKAKREALTPRAYQLLSNKLGKHAGRMAARPDRRSHR